jgi:hypothetical protein
MSKGAAVSIEKSETLQGVLDLMILKTLHALGLKQLTVERESRVLRLEGQK